MVCFFRSLTDWSHLTQRDALTWSVPVYSSNDQNGSLVIDGEWPDLTRCWCVLDGRLFYVEKAEPSEGSTSLVLRLPFHAFDRDLVYAGIGTEELGDFLTDTITNEFIGQADANFAMPYLTVSASGTTNADLSYIPGEVYPFLDIFLLGLEKGLGYNFTTSASGVTLAIAPVSPASHNLFWDNVSELINATVSRELVSKVTVRRVVVSDSEITVDSSEDYYWHPDGTISTSSSSVHGSWAIVSVEDEDIPSLTAAEEAMRGNNSAWKIDFKSDNAYNIGDSLTCSIYGESVTARITSCFVSRDDPRFAYELGDMPTTLTDKFAQALSAKVEKSVTVENSLPEYVQQSGGTVGGDFSIAGSGFISALSVGASSYGSTLPVTGTPGQVFFKI